MFVNPVKETEVNRTGILHVVTRLTWYSNLSSTLLQEGHADSAGLRIELEQRVVSLYKELLLYQMKSVCSYYRNRGLAFLRTIGQLDDWNGSLKRVTDAEAKVVQDSSVYHHQQLLQSSLRQEQLLQQLLLTVNKEAVKSTDVQPVSKPTTLPFGRNKNFIGRLSQLKELLNLVPPDADETDCQRTAIEGLGGIGKTQLALEIAYRIREEHNNCAVFWVPAVDVASFENAYLEIGRRLGVEGIDACVSGVPDPAGPPIADVKPDVKVLVKEALDRSAEPWLLIVDNADDMELLFGTDNGNVSLRDYLPFSLKGSILFTTRNHEVVADLDIPLSHTITIGEMSWTEAISFLNTYLTPVQMEDAKSTVELLEFLAYLPLALKQASAYMAKTKITVTKYLAQCQRSDVELVKLLSKDFEDRGRYKTISNPITTTWLISFNHISRDKPLAVEYLKFMSLLAEKDIPRTILPADYDDFGTDEAIATLKAYAFINERSSSERYDMHRLVRLAMRNWLAKEDELQTRVTAVIRRLKSVFPFPDHTNKNIWFGYIPHASAALQLYDVVTDQEAVIYLLDWLAKSYTYTGNYLAAEMQYQRAIELSTLLHGSRHTATLRLLSNLGGVYFERGRPEQAEPIWRDVLSRRIEVLGLEHPDTLFSMDSLALDLQFQGREEDAAVVIEQVYDLRLRSLGANNPCTLSSAAKLAESIRRKGRHTEAEALSRQTFDLMQDILGAHHPDTIDVLRCLSVTIADQGRYEEAEGLFRQALEVCTRTLGEAHPKTLTVVLNLADTIRNQARYDEAEKMYRDTLEVREISEGIESASALKALCRLARCVERQGKTHEAESLYRQVIEMRERIHGAVAYQTSEARLELALFLQGQMRYAEAEEILRDILSYREKEYGMADFRTLETLDVLASVIQDQEKFEEAEETLRKLLNHQENVFGLEDSRSIDTTNSLAYVLYEQDNWQGAEELYRRVFEWRARELGIEDSKTLESLDSLAYNIQKQGRLDEAEALFRRLLEARSRVFGIHAQETLDTMEDLKDLLVEQAKRGGSADYRTEEHSVDLVDG